MSLDFYSQKGNQQSKRIRLHIQINPSLKEIKVLTKARVQKGKRGGMLLIGSCFNLPSYTTKDNLLSDGTNHFGWSQDNFSQKCHLIWAIPQLRAHTHTHVLKVYLIVFQPSHGLSFLLSSQSLPCNTIFSIPRSSHQLFVLRKCNVFHGYQQNRAHQASLRLRTSPCTEQDRATLQEEQAYKSQ